MKKYKQIYTHGWMENLYSFINQYNKQISYILEDPFHRSVNFQAPLRNRLIQQLEENAQT